MRARYVGVIFCFALFGCGGEEGGEVALKIGLSQQGLLDGVNVFRIAFHSSTRACSDLLKEPFKRAIVFREGALSELQNNQLRIEEIPADTYTVMAVGGPDRDNATVFGCEQNRKIENGKRAEIGLTLQLIDK